MTQRTITTCEVCGGNALEPLLDLGAQPMCDDLVPIGSDRQPQAYPLQLGGCPTCLTVHQLVQVDKTLLFPQDYHYRAALTQDVLDGMAELVASVGEHVDGLTGKRVLDIGCNDGSLLGKFRMAGALTAGIEPTGAASEAATRADWVHHGFFDAAAVEAYLAANPRPDVITFTNVFAHIEDLRGLIVNVRALLGPATRVVVENHYLGAVVARTQFDTFYHEHPRTYSARSFDFIADALGLAIERLEFPPRYNGNIRVVMGPGKRGSVTLPDESVLLAGVAAMTPRIAEARDRLHDRLRPLADAHGPLPAKAFPGRAAILIHSLDMDETLIDATYERSSSLKVGHYVPGTRIEIRDEIEFLRDRLESPVLVNLAWHIHAEIERYMRSHGYRGEIVPVFA